MASVAFFSNKLILTNISSHRFEINDFDFVERLLIDFCISVFF
jgi:hypothetical protein